MTVHRPTARLSGDLERNLRDGVNVLADWAEKGLKIVVVTQQLELNGVIGRTIAALLLGLAEIEHGNIRERQKAGIEAAKARGVYTGRTVGSTKANPGRARELKKQGSKHGRDRYRSRRKQAHGHALPGRLITVRIGCDIPARSQSP